MEKFTLKVSAATVSKFRFKIENSQVLLPVLKKILKNEKIKEFLEELLLTLWGPGTPGIDWSQAWKDKIEFERRKARRI